MSFFDDFDWGRVIESAVQVIPSVIGTSMTNRANTKAAQIATDAGAQQAQAIQAGNAAAIEELRQSRESAERIGAPGVQHLQRVVARNPAQMTPAQEQAIKDAQLEFNRGPAMKSYGGRAHSRMFSDMTNRVTMGAQDTNRREADAAAGNLTGFTRQAMSVAPAIANVQARTGEQVGRVAGQVGDTQAGAVTANANTSADAMGQIASVFANAMKDQDRESRYRGYKTSIEG